MSLFGEPSLTAPVFDRLFTSLREHTAWRRTLPQLEACLIDSLTAAGVSSFAAQAFSLLVRPSSAAAAAASGGGLDDTDVHALAPLRLRFEVRWPLELALSDVSLAKHEEIFGFLLQLRRARWALDTSEERCGGGGGGERRVGAHPWRVVRAELRHVVSCVYTHLTIGVLAPEWRAALAALQGATDVDSFRREHEAFAARAWGRCFLRPSDARVRHAIERILAMALRLRKQLETLPQLAASAHAASAARWRAQLKASVRFVLEELYHAAYREPVHARRCELLDLQRLLDYNGYYEVVELPRETASEAPPADELDLPWKANEPGHGTTAGMELSPPEEKPQPSAAH